MMSKNSGGVAGAAYTLLWQFFNANKLKKNIYSLLLYSTTFQDRFKIERALPQLHKNYETFYGSNSRWPDSSFDTGKKPAAGMLLQKSILVNLRGLYKDNLKRTIQNALIYIWTITVSQKDLQ